MRAGRGLHLCVLALAACVAEPAGREGGAEKSGRAAVRRAWAESRDLSGRERVRPQAAFQALFVRSDWSAFDADTDRDLLRTGLWRAGRQALDRGDGGLALKAWEDYTRRFQESRSIRQIRYRYVPRALALAGRREEASAHLAAETLGDANAADRAERLVLFGDLRLLEGDIAGACEAWTRAAEVPFDASALGPVRDARRKAAARRGFIGKRAPPFTAVATVGGEAPGRSDRKGRILVVQAFSVGCRSCRRVWPSLDALRKRYASEGVRVIGLTMAEAEGFLPEAGTPEPSWVGEKVEGIARGDFVAHLEAIRTRIGIEYPWLVQTIGPQLAWNCYEQHPVVVVDRDGMIAFADVGGEDLSIVHAMVRRLLEE